MSVRIHEASFSKPSGSVFSRYVNRKVVFIRAFLNVMKATWEPGEFGVGGDEEEEPEEKP